MICCCPDIFIFPCISSLYNLNDDSSIVNASSCEIPILDKDTIENITDLVKQAFKLKDEKKRLIAEVRETMDSYFEL